VDRKPQVLIVGTGYYGFMKVPPETEKMVKAQGIELVVDVTEKACKSLQHRFTVKENRGSSTSYLLTHLDNS